MAPRVEAWRTEVASWPEALREEWEERAAIAEFDAGMARAAAEFFAYRLLRPAGQQRELFRGA